MPRRDLRHGHHQVAGRCHPHRFLLASQSTPSCNAGGGDGRPCTFHFFVVIALIGLYRTGGRSPGPSSWSARTTWRRRDRPPTWSGGHVEPLHRRDVRTGPAAAGSCWPWRPPRSPTGTIDAAARRRTRAGRPSWPRRAPPGCGAPRRSLAARGGRPREGAGPAGPGRAVWPYVGWRTSSAPSATGAPSPGAPTPTRPSNRFEAAPVRLPQDRVARPAPGHHHPDRRRHGPQVPPRSCGRRWPTSPPSPS